MKTIVIISFYLIFLLGDLCSAQEVIPELTSSEVTLVIKPNICVASRGEKNCISSFDISWYSNRVGDYCLRTANEKQSLKCWQSEDSGFFKHKISIQQDLSYWISSMITNNHLAKSTVKFAALKPHRKHNRRSRLPWTIQSL